MLKEDLEYEHEHRLLVLIRDCQAYSVGNIGCCLTQM